MNPLLISGFGNHISVDKRRLTIVNKLDNYKFEFYPHQIPYDSIIIDGHTGNISFEAVRWLMKHDIPITMLNWDGNILSTTLPKESISGKLKLKQYDAYQNEERRYKIAFTLIESKVKSELDFLKELATYYDIIDIEGILNRVAVERNAYYRDIGRTKGIKGKINVLMLYEARIANIYWDQLAAIFKELYPDFNFQSRKNKSFFHNRNASDEINALLNYGYAILETEIKRAINSVGLDSSIGFLHEVNASKLPLAYDLQELYRWLVDLSVLQLLEEKKLKKSDFIVTENYHIRLRPTTAKMLIEKIKINFNTTTTHRNMAYKNQVLISENLRALVNSILDNTNLPFTLPEIKLKRNDQIDLKQKILDMTPTERKRLGINKSTLWYMKKNIKEGKRIKIYDKMLEKF